MDQNYACVDSPRTEPLNGLQTIAMSVLHGITLTSVNVIHLERKKNTPCWYTDINDYHRQMDIFFLLTGEELMVMNELVTPQVSVYNNICMLGY